MFAVPRLSRKPAAAALAVLAALWLAACEPIGTGNAPAIDTSAPVPVALLLPGGAGDARDDLVATNLKQAADLAVADLQGVRIDLRVYTTGATAAGAAQAATQAVDQGAKIILGPVFADAANAAGVAVAARGVNVLSFSNNTDIAGGNVFVLGPTFQNTANRLVSYAAATGHNRIFVVHDQTPAGQLADRAIESAAATYPATIVGTANYEFSQQGVVSAAPAIAAKAKAAGANSVFITADTAGALPLLTQLLKEQGLTAPTYQFVGLTRWDIPGTTLALPGVQGGWFALPDPALSAQFAARYQAAYGQPPLPVAGLAYDGIAAIGALVRSGNASALSASALTQGAGFAGVNGVFRLKADGTNDRGLAVAQIQNSQVVVIDPAPRSFGGAGF